MKQMKRLTVKEEEIMRIFWEHGPMFVRELLSFYDEPIRGEKRCVSKFGRSENI